MWKGVFFGPNAKRFPIWKHFNKFMEEKKKKCKEEGNKDYQGDVVEDNYLVLLELFMDINKGISGNHSIIAFDISFPALFDDFI